VAVKFTNKAAPAKAAPVKEKPKRVQKDGRRFSPTKRGYSVRVFERLFEYVAAGEDLSAACKRPGMPTVWTVRRRLAVDDVLNDRYMAAQKIRLHGHVDELLRLPDEAIAGIAKVSAADRLTAAKQKADSIKWIAQKLLTEFQGLEDGGGSVTLNIVNSPDAPPAAGPYVPAGQPVLKIVGGSEQ
jgi:hypothetical protein